MSLNVKLALVISVGFITGMCWLVNRAGRPLIEEPSPLPAPAGSSLSSPRGVLSAQPATPGSGVFKRPSPVEPAPAPVVEPAALAVATPMAVVSDRPREHVALPPFLASSRQPEPAAAAADMPARAGGERRLPPSLAALEDASGGASPTVPGATPMVAASAVSTPLTPVLSRSAAGPTPVLDRNPAAASEPAKSAHAAELSKPAAAPDAPPPQAERRYAIQRGDSLAAIVRREWKGREEEGMRRLFAANPQLAKRADRIYVGEEIVIPLPDVPADARRDIAATPGPSPVRAGSPRADSRPTPQVSANRAVASNRDAAADTPPNPVVDASRTDAPDRAAKPEPSTGRKPAARESESKPRTTPHVAPPSSPRTRPVDTDERRVASADPSARGSLTARKSSMGARKTEASERKTAAETKAAARVYTVKAADSLKTIAERELNDPRRWREIAQLNGVKDPNKVLVGAKLRLPAGDRVAQR